MSFGSRLRERREALHLKQSELGQMLGVTGSAIGNYEKGVSSPKADILYKVFDVLQCDANYLFQDEMSKDEKNAPSKDDEAVARYLMPEESELVNLYRSLNRDGKSTLLAAARGFAGNPAVREEKYSSETA